MKTMENRTFGYLYDLWVFVVGQSADIHTARETTFRYENLTYTCCAYAGPNSFAFPICDSPGVYYNVLSSFEEEGGTVFIRENASVHEHFFCAPWKNREEIEDMKPITIDPGYREDIRRLLRELVNQSPVKKLYVQIRRQGLERDNIMGMLTVEQFGDMMERDELLGNMVYVIREAI